ncbi:PH domain-containing protein [Streptomyces griseofuscus]|uniref:PH domain-containing protein n=1 Tax=Streptomyces TaxID=1883 RepID=UPI00081E63BD|nr:MULTISPECIES: PH domain-containing protein [unclassified Streptomyces]MBJ6999933.1 PH domain-containing protein [Streptomyces sp. CRPSP2-6A1]MYQ94753.1 PH domain-containing protein [Streptomyces sp. SID4946]MYR90779.1 PH domain-containing protein [Streptomyces sp. SID685]SCF91069.1 PH domain-containing protein [Streptomyces sp. DconLS]SCG03707.1 PH domain-containing protein [Streptomyces sp. LamerLS-31b]
MSDLPTLPGLPVTFRPGHTRAILLTAAVAIFLTISGVALLLEGLGPGERMSFVVTGALIFWVLAQLARIKVVADESGVTVVNIASSRRLAWAEILQVNLRPGDPWVFLNLSDGTSLPALGIQPGIARQRAIADAKALRALAEAHSAVRPGEDQG